MECRYPKRLLNICITFHFQHGRSYSSHSLLILSARFSTILPTSIRYNPCLSTHLHITAVSHIHPPRNVAHLPQSLENTHDFVRKTPDWTIALLWNLVITIVHSNNTWDICLGFTALSSLLPRSHHSIRLVGRVPFGRQGQTVNELAGAIWSKSGVQTSWINKKKCL